jgi:hypothetical protein
MGTSLKLGTFRVLFLTVMETVQSPLDLLDFQITL